MNQVYYKLLDKVSLNLLRAIGRLEDELGASDLEGASEVLASIPAILLAIAVQRLSADLPQEEVASVLEAMIAKVEIGDFHNDSDMFHETPNDSCGCTDGEEGSGNGNSGNILN
jgi:hypothetical protein